MNKSVITSVRPRECELIARGQQTMLVRKTRPKIETPFKDYIYCSKGKMFLYKNPNNGELFLDSNGGYRGGDYEDRYLTGKVIGSFVCDKVEKIEYEAEDMYVLAKRWAFNRIAKQACLTAEQLKEYMNGNKGYGWRITEPKLFDKPKELGEFSKFGYKYAGGCCINYECPNYIDNGWMQPPECKINGCFLTRPPQSWVYCEPIEKE